MVLEQLYPPRDLRTALIGSPNIDISDLRATARITGSLFGEGDKDRVDWSWEILEKFEAQHRTMFYEFATGSRAILATDQCGNRHSITPIIELNKTT